MPQGRRYWPQAAFDENCNENNKTEAAGSAIPSRSSQPLLFHVLPSTWPAKDRRSGRGNNVELRGAARNRKRPNAFTAESNRPPSARAITCDCVRQQKTIKNKACQNNDDDNKQRNKANNKNYNNNNKSNNMSDASNNSKNKTTSALTETAGVKTTRTTITNE